MKGKERQTVGELYDLFESVSHPCGMMMSDQTLILIVFLFLHFLQLASELWPVSAAAAVEGDDDESHADSDVGEVEEDLEKQIAKELASIKRPRKEQMFGMLHPQHRPHDSSRMGQSISELPDQHAVRCAEIDILRRPRVVL